MPESLREELAKLFYEDVEVSPDAWIINEIFRKIKKRLPAEKDTSGQFQINAVYVPFPKDGDKVEYTHKNYDERRGWNSYRQEVLTLLEAPDEG